WRDAWRKRELSSERAKAAANTALGSSSDAGAPKVSLTHSTSRAGWISAGAVVVVVVAVVATSPIQPEERWPRSPKADSEQAATSTHAAASSAAPGRRRAVFCHHRWTLPAPGCIYPLKTFSPRL